MKLKKNAISFLITCMSVGLLGIGFSSWLYNLSSIKTDVNSEFGDVMKDTYNFRDSIYFLGNTEQMIIDFDINNVSEINVLKVKVDLVINPTKIEQLDFFEQTIIVDIQLCHDYSNGFSFFDNNKVGILAPSNVEISSKKYSTLFHTYSCIKNTNETNKNEILTSQVVLMSPDEPSLYSKCKKFQVSEEDLTLELSWSFEIDKTVSMLDLSRLLKQTMFLKSQIKGRII